MGDFNHGIAVSLVDGDNLNVKYEFNAEFLDWGDENNDILFIVNATNSYNKTDRIHFHIKYDESSGISDKTVSHNGIDFYPNPAEDVINLLTDKEIKQVNIYDRSGCLISQSPFTGGRLSVTHLHSGSYLIQIITADGSVVKKLIKK